ncbi:hypothetical protein [Pseudomonas alabamensis]|uniref:hypothetical protein n=1 Tax=Pseudomonas alabamensis TaxID=3064349 RepID=UPI0021D897E9|nr:hypothetical protein [Pseudomonas entomophila]
MARARIRNGNKVLLIDESYANLALREYKVVTTGAENNQFFSTVDVTFNNDQSVLAIRSSSDVAIYSVRYTPGFVTYSIIAVRGYATIECWNFDLAKYGAYGNLDWPKLIIRKPGTGEVAFDSRMRYMKVINFQYTNSESDQAAVNTSYPGTLPAVVIASQPWIFNSERIGIPNPHSTIVSQGLGFVRMNSTTVTITPLAIFNDFVDQNEGNVHPSTAMPDGYWMTLDVSNLL